MIHSPPPMYHLKRKQNPPRLHYACSVKCSLVLTPIPFANFLSQVAPFFGGASRLGSLGGFPSGWYNLWTSFHLYWVLSYFSDPSSAMTGWFNEALNIHINPICVCFLKTYNIFVIFQNSIYFRNLSWITDPDKNPFLTENSWLEIFDQPSFVSTTKTIKGACMWTYIQY